MTFDFNKEYKALYSSAVKPSVVDVPEMTFITIAGSGDPNGAGFGTATEVL